MTTSRAIKRRKAAITSAKVLITSASLAATLGGWAVISAVENPILLTAQAQVENAISTLPSTGTQRNTSRGVSPQAPPIAPGQGRGDLPQRIAPAPNQGTQGFLPAPAPLQPRPRLRTRSSR